MGVYTLLTSDPVGEGQRREVPLGRLENPADRRVRESGDGSGFLRPQALPKPKLKNFACLAVRTLENPEAGRSQFCIDVDSTQSTRLRQPETAETTLRTSTPFRASQAI
jgi:hypothetical protein